jgi:hypothetical protein
MGHHNVRMGGSKGIGVAKLAAFLSLAAFVGVAVFVGMAIVSPGAEAPAEKKAACSSDAECGPGRMCAAGGCIILLSSEHAGMWRDDIAAQLDPAAAWRPTSHFGEKIIPAGACALREGEVRESDAKHVLPLIRISIYEIGPEGMVLHKMMRSKGDMWIESLRFRFPDGLRPGPSSLCASDSIDRFRLVGEGEGSPAGQIVDVSLKQSVPVGGIAAGSVAVSGELPAAGADGVRSLDLPLDALEETETAGHTVLAFPLGSSVVSMEGPPPSKQRLLDGYLAYYWSHEKEASEVTVRFKVASRAAKRLDLSTLNP